MPTAQDLFASLAGGKVFTKFELRQAYHHLELEDESKQYLVINSRKGLYSYERLSFGVSSAPSQFQKVMDQILQGLEGVVCYLDDVLIASKTKNDHLRMIDEVFRRFAHHGIRLKREKCFFLLDNVEYLGHRIDAEGLHTMQEKGKALNEARRPTDVSELKSFLGLLRYYQKFLPDIATAVALLDHLTHKDVTWRWTVECKSAFTRC